MRVIGTAGHVDHGKSSLVQALTGTHPDRLKAEQKRGMTLDLGFAWMQSAGQTLGIVDVPGHRDFIDNMLSGVGNIDAALLVIAADEGIMPQTREHLAIVHLLNIPSGVIALTKTDLTPDEDWLTLIEADIRQAVKGTVFAQAPIVRVSAKTRAGLPELHTALAQSLQALPPRPNLQRPYLPIDRVFTLKGLGTIVTGTLSGGTLQLGDELELQPAGLGTRVRNLQSYGQNVDVAQIGSRVAVNLGGVPHEAVARGMVLSRVGMFAPTQLIDVFYNHLPDAPHALKHNAQVKLFTGTAQSMANVRLLDAEHIERGANGWLQLRLHQPIACLPRARFILRDPAQRATLGGGEIINPRPTHRYKRFRPSVIDALILARDGDISVRLLHMTHTPQHLDTLRSQLAAAPATLHTTLEALITQGEITRVAEDTYINSVALAAQGEQLINALADHHTHNPTQQGISKAALRQQLQLSPTLLDALIAQQHAHITQTERGLLHLREYQPHWTPTQQAAMQALYSQMRADPPHILSLEQARAALETHATLLEALIANHELVRIGDFILEPPTYAAHIAQVDAMLSAAQEVSAKTVRDTLQSSRKYAITLLEHLDKRGITRRVGDLRTRGNRPP